MYAKISYRQFLEKQNIWVNQARRYPKSEFVIYMVLATTPETGLAYVSLVISRTICKHWSLLAHRGNRIRQHICWTYTLARHRSLCTVHVVHLLGRLTSHPMIAGSIPVWDFKHHFSVGISFINVYTSFVVLPRCHKYVEFNTHLVQ